MQGRVHDVWMALREEQDSLLPCQWIGYEILTHTSLGLEYQDFLGAHCHHHSFQCQRDIRITDVNPI